MEIHVVRKVMKVNDELAAVVRRRLEAAGLRAVNIMSAPGSGKTSLIEAVVSHTKLRLGVIEGDPDTTLDAERIARHNIPVTQIETAGGCHLEANLILQALDELPLDQLDVLLIENVGNLVCPVGFDLGESVRVAVLSTPEGHDKPVKYPRLFRETDLVVLNKIDLTPHVGFDRDTFYGYMQRLNPDAPVLEVSCTTGEGVAEWANWLEQAAQPAPAG